MQIKNSFKKVSLLIGTALTITVLSFGSVYAQRDATVILEEILAKLTAIETMLNSKLTQIVNAAEALATIWTAPDTSQFFLNLKNHFENLGTRLTTNLQEQRDTQRRLNTDLLGSPADNRSRLFYANDILYSSVLGVPYFDPDPRNQNPNAPRVDSPYNYIKNASGINIPHVVPGNAWRGNKEAQDKYQAYYNLVTAVASFNGYVLSNQYIDRNQLNDLQLALIQEANSKDWYDELSTEINMSVLMRRMLMFQSQIFVLLTQLIQTQKQLVTAQAMTNSLLVASQHQNEILMLSGAQGIRPSM